MLYGGGVNAQVGIGTTTPNASAVLDLTSTTQGLLPPRMTQAQRDAIASPVAGLMVYQSDGTSGLYYYTGSAWVYIINGTAGSGDMTLAGVQTVTGAKTFGAAGNVGKLVIAGSTSGTTILNANATAGTGTVVLPTTGTLATLAGTETLTNKTLTAAILEGTTVVNETGAATNFRVESDLNENLFFVDGTNNEIGINTATPNSTLDIQGSIGYKINTITAATTLNQTHNVVLCNTGPYTVTLPAAAANTGKVYYIKSVDAEGDDITIDGNASETIDGATVFVLDPYKHAVRIVSDGANWHVLEEAGQLSNNNNPFTPINCNGTIFTWNNVTNPTTGRVWMDRNLGASQVATASNDANAYGDLYQWGRAKDGHQCRTSPTTTTLSKENTPGHGKFIINPASYNFDWRSPSNTGLWQGVNGINNPCPTGYRLPTSAEWTSEVATWSANSAAGGFASVLKLTVGGHRRAYDGCACGHNGSAGWYWSSAYNGRIGLNGSDHDMGSLGASAGRSVRCIMD